MSMESVGEALYVFPRTLSALERRTDAEHRQFDVVAVHGLGGNRDTTWTHSGDRKTTMWLKDLLPNKLDNPVIMTYEYGPLTCSKDSFTEPGIAASALDLLDRLCRKRASSQTQDRSLVLIGQDVGGIIIKKALLLAVETEKYSSIAAKTSLLVFFGTPQRGLDDTSRAVRIAGSLLSASGYCCQGDSSEVLKQLTQSLKAVSRDFQLIAGIYKTASIYEQDDGSLPAPVVDEFSARFELKDVATAVGIPRRHHELTRLQDENDEAYQKICEAIQSSREPFVEYINCLRALSSIARKDFPRRTPGRNMESFGELQGYPAYKQWLEARNGSDRILWIYGQQGSGRSNLALRAANLTSDSICDTSILEFTFDSKDDRLQSTQPMYATLCYQLLCLRPLLFDHVAPLYERIVNDSTDGPKFKLSRVWSLFRSLLSCPYHGETICIINNVDECLPSRMRFLKDLFELPKCKGSTFRLVVTSKTESEQPAEVPPENIIHVEASLGREESDISHLVERDIMDLVKRRPHYRKFASEISRVTCHSAATLHEARLALTLLESTDIRSTSSAVEKTLESIPKTEFGIHQGLLARVVGPDSDFPRKGPESSRETPGAPEQGSSWVIQALAWVAHAFRPLTLTEISEALALGPDADNNSASKVKSRVLMDPAWDLEQAFGRLIQIKNDEVFFAHKSWHDHLVEQFNLPSDGNHFPSADCHAVMARSCLTYLSLIASPDTCKVLLPGATDMSPAGLARQNHGLLPYAVQYWPSHYHKARLGEGTPQLFQQFFKNEGLVKLWSEMYWEYQNPVTRRAEKDPLAVATEVGCCDLVDVLLEKLRANVVKKRVALGIAIEAGHETLVEKLLAYGAWNKRALHSAAAYGRDSIAQRLIKSEFPVGDPDEFGYRPLHVAASCGSLGVVDKLLATKEGSKTEAETREGLTALHLASQFGHFDVARRLLDNGADIGAVSYNGSTPLHVACQWQQPGTVEFLLGREAKACSIDYHKKTPFHLAAGTGRFEIVSMLLEQISDANTRDQLLEGQDSDGRTPLHIAAELGHYEVVLELLKQTERAPGAAGLKDSEGRVPLHLGANKGYLKIVRRLLDRSRRGIKATDGLSSNPIHLAVQGCHEEVVECICKEHQRIQYPLDVFNSSTLTPLHLACDGGSTNIVKTLLQFGAQAEITGSYREEPLHTPLHISCSKGFLGITLALIRCGANPAAATSKGLTPLHLASRNGRVDVVKKLTSFLYNVNDSDNDGRLPIHLAARGGHEEVIKALRTEGADLDAYDAGGRTILHYACEGGSIEFVKELLSKFGCDVNVRDKKHQTPLHFAARSGQLGTVRVLIAAEADTQAVNDCNKTALELANDEGVIEELLPSTDGTLETDKITELMLQAARNGYGGVIQQLLQMEGSNPNLTANEGKTPLVIASSHGHLKVVQQFLQTTRIELEAADMMGRTAVSYAAENGHVEVLRSLLGHEGGNPNSMDKGGRTPMSYAAEKGHNEAIEVLFRFKAAVDTRGPQAANPLWFAASNGHDGTVNLLLEHEANPAIADDEGRTGLHLSARNNYPKVAEALLSSGSTTFGDSCDDESSTAMYIAAYYRNVHTFAVLLEKGLNKETPGPRGWRPLHAAYDSRPIVRLLLKGGAEKDATTNYGSTALVLAITNGCEDVAEELLENGADPLIPDQNGSTPLHKAARSASIGLVRLMLQVLGSKDINLRGSEGRTPFREAVDSGRVETVEAFLNRGVDLRAVADDNHTALWGAIEGEHDEVAKILLQELDKGDSSSDSGTGMGILGESSEDFLLHAAEHETFGILDMLWERVGNPAKISQHLFDLAAGDNYRLANFLLRKNACMDMKDEHGWTLFWIAFSGLSEDGKSEFEPRDHPPCEVMQPTSWSNGDRVDGVEFADQSDAAARLHIRYGMDEPETPSEEEMTAALRRLYRHMLWQRHRRRIVGVRANHPVPPDKLFYFEIKVLSVPPGGIIGIGFCLKNSPLSRFPGWEDTSWGYHGDDGGIYHGSGIEASFGNGKFAEGDFVGCGIDTSKGTAFFTRNGKRLDKTFEGIKGRVYPTVGIENSGEVVASFTAEVEPFKYNIDHERRSSG